MVPAHRKRAPASSLLEGFPMKVSCSVEEVELDGGYGLVPGIEVECQRCNHITESFGTSERSVKRCLALMREECPEDESNFYVADSDDDE